MSFPHHFMFTGVKTWPDFWGWNALAASCRVFPWRRRCGAAAGTPNLGPTKRRFNLRKCLLGGFKHEWMIFHFIYGMSSHWRTPSFFKMVISNHQADVDFVSKNTWIPSAETWDFSAKHRIFHPDIQHIKNCTTERQEWWGRLVNSFNVEFSSSTKYRSVMVQLYNIV